MSASPAKPNMPDLPEITGSAEPAASAPMRDNNNSIDHVPVTLSAVLGKTKIDLAGLRALGDGAVIELNRKVGEPIDLYVNDRLIARGELVMADGALGVTMTEIVRDDDL